MEQSVVWTALSPYRLAVRGEQARSKAVVPPWYCPGPVWLKRFLSPSSLASPATFGVPLVQPVQCNCLCGHDLKSVLKLSGFQKISALRYSQPDHFTDVSLSCVKYEQFSWAHLWEGRQRLRAKKALEEDLPLPENHHSQKLFLLKQLLVETCRKKGPC